MVVNDKIYFKLLEEEFQPKKSVFTPNADLIKIAEVVEIGGKVDITKPKDLIKIYITNVFGLDKRHGFCSQRDLLFVNDIPQPGKVHIRNQSKEPLSSLNSADVINSNSDEIIEGDKVFYRSGQSHLLPDNTEIVSETQIYYNKR